MSCSDPRLALCRRGIIICAVDHQMDTHSHPESSSRCLIGLVVVFPSLEKEVNGGINSLSKLRDSEQLCDIFISKKSYKLWSSWGSLKTRNPFQLSQVYNLNHQKSKSWSSLLPPSLPSSLSSPTLRLLVLCLVRLLVVLYESNNEVDTIYFQAAGQMYVHVSL